MVPTKWGFLLFAMGAPLWMVSIPLAIAFIVFMFFIALVEWGLISPLLVNWEEVPAKLTQRVDVMMKIRCNGGNGSLNFRGQLERISPQMEFHLFEKERGDFPLGVMEATLKGPLGLWEKRQTIDSGKTIRVAPIAKEGRASLSLQFGKEASEARKKASSRAAHGEFHSLRPYRDGESIRGIDWKVSARVGRWLVKDHEETKGHHIVALLDCGRRMGQKVGDKSRLDLALGALLQLAHQVEKQKDVFSAVAFSNQIEAELSSVEKGEILPRTVEKFSSIQAKNVESDYWQVFGQVVEKLTKRSLILLFSDMMDVSDSSGMRANLKRAAQKHVVLTVVLTDDTIEQLAEEENSDLYVRGAACMIGNARAKALEAMRGSGVRVLEAPAEQFDLKLLQSYLNLRGSL